MVNGVRGNEMANLNKAHILKVQDMGDHYLRQTIPQIRLQGKWLLKAGIIPDALVEVINPQDGILIIRVKEN